MHRACQQSRSSPDSGLLAGPSAWSTSSRRSTEGGMGGPSSRALLALIAAAFAAAGGPGTRWHHNRESATAAGSLLVSRRRIRTIGDTTPRSERVPPTPTPTHEYLDRRWPRAAAALRPVRLGVRTFRRATARRSRRLPRVGRGQELRAALDRPGGRSIGARARRSADGASSSPVGASVSGHP